MSEHELRTFVDVLHANERRLGTIAESTELLHALMTSVTETGKKGTLTIKLTVEPDKNDELAKTIDVEVSASLPKKARRKAIVYHNHDRHSFSKTDPRQLELLAEQEAERAEREAELREAGIAKIGRGVPATA